MKCLTYRRALNVAGLVAVVVAFVICLEATGIPFRPYVTTLQKVLIASFALWAGHLAWRERQ